MVLPIIGVSVAAVARFIMSKGATEAAKKFSPKLIQKAKLFLEKKSQKTAKEMYEKGMKNLKSKKKTEEDFGKTPLGKAKVKINYDSVKPKTYSYKHIDKYTRG